MSSTGHSAHHNAPCVAPHWPPFVGDEDLEWVWVRRDLENSATELIEPYGVLDEGRYRLERIREAVMVPAAPEWQADGGDTYPSFLTEGEEGVEHDDAVVYVRFEVTQNPNWTEPPSVNVKVMGPEAWTLVKPAPGLCEVCAARHDHDEPHNPDSLYWHTARNLAGEAPPTWAEALDHCPADVRERWVAALAEHGIEVSAR